MRIAFLLIFVASCTDFAPIERGVCGNGLLEAGEDCDSNDPSCVRCAVACSTAADCPTTDYACGVDGMCHAPGGVLGAPHSAGTFQANELRVTDIDHDGIGDVLGLSRTSIIVRHGEPTAQLASLDSMVTPTQTGPAAFGDLDGDGSLDIALTTTDGLVSYGAGYGELAPVAVNSGLIGDQGEPLDFRMFFHVAPMMYAAFIVDPATDNLFVVAIDGSGGTGQPVFLAPCSARLGAIKASTFDTSTVDVYNISKDNEDQYDTLVSFVVGTTPKKSCVFAVHRNAPQLLQPYPVITITDVTPASFTAPAKKPLLADLDGDSDPCPALLRTDGGPNALVMYDGSRATGNAPCGFATTTTALPPIGAPTFADVVGRVPVVPNVLLVASDGLVTSEGLYPYLPQGIPIVSPNPQFTSVYHTTRKIALVDHGDFDGDGNVDAVFAAAGEEDLDVLFRVPGQAGFNLVRLDTASSVKHLIVGDYDGNRIADVAYSELFGDNQRLMVAFGTPDRPLAPASMGVFPGILSISRIGLPDSVDYLNLADDLIVIAPPAAGQTALRMSMLHGSPQRTLLSYFDPRPDATRDETVFRGAVIGHFLTTGSTPEHADLVAIAPPTPAANSIPGKDLVKAWRVPGTPEGLDATATPGTQVDGLADCSLNRTGKLCLDLARYVAFPTAENHDVIIGIDRSNAPVMIDPWASTMSATTLDKLAAVTPANTTIHSLHAADVDGDGAPELIAAFAPTAATSAGGVAVCTMQSGKPTSCEDVVPAIKATMGAAVTQCFDAAPARLSYRDPTTTPNPASDIAVVCHGDGTSLFRVSRTGGTTVVERLVTTGKELTALRAGDVTGDRVDDLVLLEGETVTSLVVFPQCTSRDAASCHGTSTSEEVAP